MEQINQGREAPEEAAKRGAAWPAKRQAREDKKQARIERLRTAGAAGSVQLAQWIEAEL